jgi:hypothetical protein
MDQAEREIKLVTITDRHDRIVRVEIDRGASSRNWSRVQVFSRRPGHVSDWTVRDLPLSDKEWHAVHAAITVYPPEHA